MGAREPPQEGAIPIEECKIDIPEAAVSPVDETPIALCRRVFDVFDVEKTGFIDKHGFKTLVNYPDLQSNQKDRLTDADIEAMLRQIDTSQDGLVSFDEFFQWWQNPLGSGGEAEGRTRAPSQFKVIQRNLQSDQFLQNVKRFGTKETYYCALCFEYQTMETGVVLSACRHAFCRECLTDYLQASITDAKVNPTCFHDAKKGGLCGVAIAEADILALIDEPTHAKYTRFKLNQMDGNHRTCSKCEHTQIGKPQPPEIVCEKCGHKYCFAHGDAHPPTVDCTTHERANAEEERKTKAIISQKCKPCPACSSPILKSGGCNHMKCAHCRASFCWLCLQVIEDTPLPSHYKLDPANPGNTCVGKQMEGMHRTDAIFGEIRGWRRFVTTFLCIFLSVLLISILFPLSFCLTVASVSICFVCVGKRVCNRPPDSNTTPFGRFRDLVRDWFHTWLRVGSIILSFVLCIPCFLACLMAGGCWPSMDAAENPEDDFEVAPVGGEQNSSPPPTQAAATEARAEVTGEA